MSALHSRKLFGKNWLDFADYNYKDYGFLISSSKINVQINQEIIPLENVDGCCPTPPTIDCVRIEIKGKLCPPCKTPCQLGIGRDKLACELSLPDDRECGLFFDIWFSDECDNEYFARASLSRPITCDVKNTRSCTIDFSFELLLERPEYYKIKGWNKACKTKCVEPILRCGSNWTTDTWECKWRTKWYDFINFCRETDTRYDCKPRKDPDCAPEKCTITNDGWSKTSPRITSDWNIKCLRITNHTNGSYIAVQESTNLTIESADNKLTVLSGCKDILEGVDGDGIELWKWENCITVEGISEDWSEICFERFDTYQFTG